MAGPEEFLLRFRVDLSQAESELRRFSAQANAEIAKSLNIPAAKVPPLPAAPTGIASGTDLSPKQLGTVYGAQERLYAAEIGKLSGNASLAFSQLPKVAQAEFRDALTKQLGVSGSYAQLQTQLKNEGQAQQFRGGQQSGRSTASKAIADAEKKGLDLTVATNNALASKLGLVTASSTYVTAQTEAEKQAAVASAELATKLKAKAAAQTTAAADPSVTAALATAKAAQTAQKTAVAANPVVQTALQNQAAQQGINQANNQQARAQARLAQQAQNAANNSAQHYQQMAALQTQIRSDAERQIAADQISYQNYLRSNPGQAALVGAGNAAEQLTAARFNAERAKVFAADPVKREQLVQDDFTVRKEQAIQQGQLSERLSKDKEYLDAKSQSAAASKREAAIIQESVNARLALDKEYQAAMLANIKAQELSRIAEIQGTTSDDILRKGQLAAGERVLATRIRIATLEAEGTTQMVQLRAEEAILRRAQNKALKNEVAAQLKASGDRVGALSVKYGRGGINGGPTDSVGGAFGSGLFSSLTHILPAIAFFGAAQGIASSVKAAQELEIKFGQIESQLAAVGQSNSFGKVKEDILGVARETGIAADKIANIRYQTQGAFGDGQTTVGGQSGQQLVDTQTEAIAKISALTGFDTQQVIDNITAVSLAFDTTGDSIGNVAYQIENNLGVRAQETLTFLGDIAPVAKQAGFSLEEFAVIAGEANRRSGQSGSVLAEKFSRVITGIADKKKDLLDIISSNPTLSKDQGLLQAVNTDDTRATILSLGKLYNQLDVGTQERLSNVLGGPRNFQAILPALQAGDLEAQTANVSRSLDTLDERFNKLRETLGQQIKELVEALKQIGIQIYNGGLKDALNLLVDTLKLVTTVLSPAIGLFNSLNESLSGLPGKALAAYAAFKLLSAVTGGSGRIGSALGAAQAGIAARAQAGVGYFRAQQPAAGQLSLFPGITNPSGLQQGAQRLQQSIAQQYAGFLAAPATYTPQAGRFASRFPRLSAAGSVVGSKFPTLSSQTPGADFKGTFAQAGGLEKGLLGLAVITSAIQVKQAYDQNRSEVESARKGLQEALGKATQQRVEELAESHSTFFDNFKNGLFGQKNPEDYANEELAKRAGKPGADRLAAAGSNADVSDEALQKAFQDTIDRVGIDNLNINDQGATLAKYGIADRGTGGGVPGAAKPRLDASQITKEKLKKIAEDAAKGDGAAANLAIALGQGFFSEEEFKGILSTITPDVDKQNAISGAAEQIEQVTQTIEQAEGDLKNGRGNIQGLLQKYTENIDLLNKTIADSGGFASPETQALIDELSAKRSATYLQGTVQSVDQIQDINKLLAEDDPTENLKARLQARLDAINSGQLTPTDTRKTVAEVIELQQQVNIAATSRASTAEEAIAIATQRVPEVDALAVTSSLNELNAKWGTFLTAFKDAYGEKGDELVKQLINDVLLGNKTPQEAAAEIEQRIQALQFAGAPQSTIDSLNVLKGSIETNDYSQLGGPNVGQAANFQAQKAILDAQAAKTKALAADNPVAAANAEIQAAQANFDNAVASGADFATRTQAEAALITARKSKAKALIAIADAQADYAMALVEGNPVASAQQSVKNAQRAYDIATANGDEAGQYQALAAQVRAQHQVRDAVFDIQSAKADYFASFSQDPIAEANAASQKADIAYQKAVASGDVAAQYQALAEKNRANQQRQDAINDIEDAKAEYAASLVAGDPVRSAQLAIDNANRSYANAQGEAERYRALAEKIKADQSFINSIRAVYDAQAAVAEAVAEYRGDSVAVAQLRYQAAITALQRTKEDAARGQAGEADIKNAEAELIRAQGSLRDARIRKQQDDYAFQYEMGQITKSQYIQYLEGLKSLADGNQEIIRDLDRQIKQLKDQLGQDLQFNLPTNIGLPTLYEARRLNQSVGANGQSVGYQDNRNVNIEIVVNDGLSAEQAQQTITDALSSSNRFGSAPRRY